MTEQQLSVYCRTDTGRSNIIQRHWSNNKKKGRELCCRRNGDGEHRHGDSTANYGPSIMPDRKTSWFLLISARWGINKPEKKERGKRVDRDFRFLDPFRYFRRCIPILCLALTGAGGERMMQQRVFCGDAAQLDRLH